MKFGEYTSVDDVENLLEMVKDTSLDLQKRRMAVVDLSLADDFDTHRLLDFAADKSQPSEIRGEIFDKQNWDERSIPIILNALQEDNDEIQFWAAFALATKWRIWRNSELDEIIHILNEAVGNNNIAPDWYQVGREALYPLERAYYSKINSGGSDIFFSLISPRLEYWDFMMARQKGEVVLEPTLQIDPKSLQQKIGSRFKSAKFNVRRPKAERYLLDWWIGYGNYPLIGALHEDGFSIVLTGMESSVRCFAGWYRTIISDEHVLRLYEWSDPGEIL